MLGAGDFLGIPISIWMLIVVGCVAAYIATRTPLRPLHLRRRRQRAGRGPVRREGQPGQVFRLHVLRLLRRAGRASSSPRSSSPPHPATGDTFELNAIAAAVLGGTSMSGGRGKIGGTIIGAFVIGVLSDGLVMMGVSAFWQTVIKGLVIIAAVVIDQAQQRVQSRVALQAQAALGRCEETSMKGALIGCGFFAQNQLHAWRDIDGAEIVALCDRDPERLAATAETFGIARTYTDAAAMFAAEELDFVDIATTVPEPPAAGRDWPPAPAATSSARSPSPRPWTTPAPWWARVEAAGRTLMVHENFRWQSAVRKAIETVRSGAIGTPFFGRVAFRSGYDVYSGQPYLAEGERFIIEDLGIHILDIARALFGDVERIAATTKRVNPKIRGEDVATMLLAHDGGVTSVVDCSYATRRTPETFPQSLLEIDGTEGTLRLDAGYSLVVQSGGDETVTDVSPPVLPWAERPWHNIQESVRIIQQHFVACIDAGTRAGNLGRRQSEDPGAGPGRLSGRRE